MIWKQNHIVRVPTHRKRRIHETTEFNFLTRPKPGVVIDFSHKMLGNCDRQFVQMLGAIRDVSCKLF